MLLVQVPNTYVPERRYIIYTLMQDFLGLDIQILINEREDVLIEDNSTAKGRSLRITDILFQTPEDQWLTPNSLPKQPLAIWDTSNTCHDVCLIYSRVPVIYGCEARAGGSKSYLTETPDEVYLGLDIFGSAFFMLTRYEEYVKQDRDQHDRFQATTSLAYQEGFLGRPIINEYIEILWYYMKRLWPGLVRKQRCFRTIVSHDVDVPFAQMFTGISGLIRNCMGDILKRKSQVMALKRINSWKAVRQGEYKDDLNYTFDRIMDISEQNNLKSAFYFKTACTNEKFDDKYSIDHPYIRQLMREIHNRGHEIGLHTSYETYHNPKQTKQEFQKLLQACDEENIHQDHWGGRQHYLRWKVPDTWSNWAEAGLNYDSTLSYADHTGFRCGVCYEFTVYDLEQRIPLSIIERPLIVMECSVLGQQYMGLEGEAAMDSMCDLRQRCQQLKGDFTLLWHNSSFSNPAMLEMYENMIKAC